MTEWYSIDNLKQAWKYTKHDVRDDFFWDVIRYWDILANKDSVINVLHNQLQNGQYHPTPLLRTGIPKNQHSVRPGTTGHFVDMVALYALAQQLAPLLDPLLKPNAFAYRLSSNKKQLFHRIPPPGDEPEQKSKDEQELEIEEQDVKEHAVEFPSGWFWGWKAFKKASQKAEDEETYIAETDITAFFENVSLRLLRERLFEYLNLDERPDVRNLITRLFDTLEYWDLKSNSQSIRDMGLPQGNDISSFLANIYLIDVDNAVAEIVKKEKYFTRYVDDINIYTSDYDEARQALVILEEKLRALNLNVQTAKTKIMEVSTSPEIAFRNESDNWLDKLSNENSEKLDNAIDFYENTYLSLSNDDKHKWERVYRRCLTIFQDLSDARAVEVALEMFLENPSAKLLRKNFQYLLRFVSSFDYSERLAQRLQDKKFTFPYHRAFFLRLGAYARDENEELKNFVLQIALNSEDHWFCRSAALFCASTFALNKDELGQIGKIIATEANSQVQRAAFVALCQHSGQKLEFVLDQLAYFNAPYQEHLKHYFVRLTKDTNLARQTRASVETSMITDPRFVDRLHQLDLLKVSPTPTEFFNLLQGKIDNCDPSWTRLLNRLTQIKEAFIASKS